MSRLLLATTNPGKQRELRRLLAGLPATVVGPAEIGLDLDVHEPHHTYAENAAEKARAYCAASGLLTLADDSGLEVAALDWGPGVRTNRFGGPGVADPVAHLLERVAGVDDRRARMVCCLALGIPDDGQPPRIEFFTGRGGRRAGPRATRQRRLWLRPDLPPPLGPDHRRAARGGEGPHLASRHGGGGRHAAPARAAGGPADGRRCASARSASTRPPRFRRRPASVPAPASGTRPRSASERGSGRTASSARTPTSTPTS